MAIFNFWKPRVKTKAGNVYNNQAFGDYQNNSSDSFSGDKAELASYSKFAWVAIAADCIGRDAGNRKYWFEDAKGNEITNVPDEIILPFETGYANKSIPQINSNMVVHRAITGNAYYLKSKATGLGIYKDMTDTFIPLRPDMVKIVTKFSGLFIDYYEVTFDDQTKRKFLPNEIIHFNQNALINPFCGIGNIEKARRMYETEARKEAYSSSFYKNGASPSLAITEETERTADDIQRLQKILNDKYSGSDNAGKTIYMAGKGISVNPLLLTQKDMQFIEEKNFTRQAVLSIFGVPTLVAGIPDGVNRATAEVQESMYYKNTINPIITDYEDSFNRQFVNKINPNIFIRFEKHNTGDIENTIKKLQAGIITPNMAAEAVGEPVSEDEEMNTYYMPSNLMPVGYEPPTPVAAPVTEKPEDAEEMDEDIEDNAEEIDEDKPADDEGKNVSRETICACGVDHKHNDPHNFELIAGIFEKKTDAPRKYQAQYLRESLRARAKTEDNYTPDLEKFFIRQKSRIMAKFNLNKEKIARDLVRAQEVAGTTGKSIDKKLLEDFSDNLMDDAVEDEDLRKTVRPLHTSAIQKAIGNTNNITNGTTNPNLSNFAVAALIGSLGMQLINGSTRDGKRIDINETTADNLDRIINRAVKEGYTIEKLQTELSEKLSIDSVHRARRIARTESRKAYDAGSKVSYKELGVSKVDVVGCTQFEPDSDCGAQNVPIDQPLSFHPNHIGCIVPSEPV